MESFSLLIYVISKRSKFLQWIWFQPVQRSIFVEVASTKNIIEILYCLIKKAVIYLGSNKNLDFVFSIRSIVRVLSKLVANIQVCLLSFEAYGFELPIPDEIVYAFLNKSNLSSFFVTVISMFRKRNDWNKCVGLSR